MSYKRQRKGGWNLISIRCQVLSPSPLPFIGSQGHEKFVDWEDALLLLIDSAYDYGAVTILMLLPIHMHVLCYAEGSLGVI